METRNDLSDGELILAYRRGETTASEALFQRYWPKVRELAMRYLHSGDEAEDVAQDILVKVLVGKKLLDFRGQSQFWSWLYRITVNACKSQLQKKSRLHEVHYENWEQMESFRQLSHGFPDPETLAIQIEELDLLQTVWDRLTPQYQQGILKICLENQSYADASKAMKVPLHTLGVQVMRAKQLLAKWVRLENDQRDSQTEAALESGLDFLPEAA